ncbi:MAG: CsgG/HfaB family protein [candidate division WOR-3 bacterium]
MRRVLYFTPFLILLSCASVEDKVRSSSVDYTISPMMTFDTIKTIAVFTKEQVLYDEAVLNLLKTGKFDVIDRQRIDEILEEQEFSHSGLVDQETAVKVGKLLGANLIAFVEKISSDRDFDAYTSKVSVKIIDVQTGRIMYVATAYGQSYEDGDDALKEGCKNAFYPLVKKFATNGEGDNR